MYISENIKLCLSTILINSSLLSQAKERAVWVRVRMPCHMSRNHRRPPAQATTSPASRQRLAPRMYLPRSWRGGVPAVGVASKELPHGSCEERSHGPKNPSSPHPVCQMWCRDFPGMRLALLWGGKYFYRCWFNPWSSIHHHCCKYTVCVIYWFS